MSMDEQLKKDFTKALKKFIERKNKDGGILLPRHIIAQSCFREAMEATNLQTPYHQSMSEIEYHVLGKKNK